MKKIKKLKKCYYYNNILIIFPLKNYHNYNKNKVNKLTIALILITIIIMNLVLIKNI